MAGLSRVLVVGANSLIAREVLARAPDAVTAVGCSHNDWMQCDIGSFDAVLNCAFDPAHYRTRCPEDADLDLAIARECAEQDAHFVMLSSRKVYAPEQAGPLGEGAILGPDSPYGENKLATEHALGAVPGLRHTVLRLANIFSFEPGRHTFFGTALRTLKDEGHITLDVSPLVERDFIAVSDCAHMIWRVIEAGTPGTFNIGRGHGTQLGAIAMWLVGGFGCGEVRVVSGSARDPFVLDTSSYRAAFGAVPMPETVEEQCISIGERLAQWKKS